MPKRKSKFIGFMLVLFGGPICFLYIRKWKKSLVLIALMLVPFINIIVYLYCLFAISSNVKRYNGDLYDNVRFGIVVCGCQSQNKPHSKFCTNCGLKLVKTCNECNMVVEKKERYCSHCGNAFTKIAKRRIALRKWLSFA